jgi:hypothetical protein
MILHRLDCARAIRREQRVGGRLVAGERTRAGSLRIVGRELDGVFQRGPPGKSIFAGERVL